MRTWSILTSLAMVICVARTQQSYSYTSNRQVQSSVKTTARDSSTPTTAAVARVEGPGVTGMVHFTVVPGTSRVQVQGMIQGLTDGQHGFHIHQYGDQSEGCKSMAGHFNPDSFQHGSPQDNFRHVGDLGNIESRNGVARFNIVDEVIQLNGRNSIIGRGVVVHANVDDLGRGGVEESRKTGNAGGRVACGVVALAKGN